MPKTTLQRYEYYKKKRSEIIIPAAETVQTSKIQDLMVREIWKRDSLIKINKD